MNIYIITENNFFFIGIKEKLAERGKFIKMVLPLEFNVIKLDEFSDTDTFVLQVENYSTDHLFLRITRRLLGRIILTQTKRKSVRVSKLENYRVLGYIFFHQQNGLSQSTSLSKIDVRRDCNRTIPPD
ncbi:hypothetical protein [Serratia fonticola]|uniref:hypothetical protein n=1 Tax=Serratia fonticola TaxID=47917 RepID=UPI003AF35AA3